MLTLWYVVCNRKSVVNQKRWKLKKVKIIDYNAHFREINVITYNDNSIITVL